MALNFLLPDATLRDRGESAGWAASVSDRRAFHAAHPAGASSRIPCSEDLRFGASLATETAVRMGWRPGGVCHLAAWRHPDGAFRGNTRCNEGPFNNSAEATMASVEKDRDEKKDTWASRHQVEVYFEHQGREITLVFSLLSGHEQVFVDNQRVAQCRNWHFRNVHAFDIGGVSYALEVAVKKNLKSVLFGIVSIQLRANGTVVDSDQVNGLWHLAGKGKDGHPLTWKRLLAWLLPFFAVGLIVGFAVGYFGLKHFF